MKNIIILIVLFFLSINSIFALKHVGAKLSYNFAGVYGNDVNEKFGTKYGYAVGWFIDGYIKENVSVKTEFLYTLKGMTYSIDNYDFEDNFHYLELPVLLSYHFDRKKSPVTIYAGPSISLINKATEKIKLNSDSYQYAITQSMNKLDLSFNTGIVVFPTDRFFVDVRFSPGLTNIFKTMKIDDNEVKFRAKNKVLMFGVGIVFE